MNNFTFHDTNELADFLIQHGIHNTQLQSWGATPDTKPLAKLFKEVNNGESHITLINNKAVRKVFTSVVHIFSTPALTSQLMEIHHLDENRNITKTRNMPPMEKIMADEKPLHAAYRGICEEIDYTICQNIRGVDGRGILPVPFNPDTYKICDKDYDSNCIKIIKSDSFSFPGLPMENVYYHFAVVIPELTDKYGFDRSFITTEYDENNKFKRYIQWNWD